MNPCAHASVATEGTTKCDYFLSLLLFFQFIDGRLSKLNAGRGFSDVFEEEITAGGFGGGIGLIWVYSLMLLWELFNMMMSL